LPQFSDEKRGCNYRDFNKADIYDVCPVITYFFINAHLEFLLKRTLPRPFKNDLIVFSSAIGANSRRENLDKAPSFPRMLFNDILVCGFGVLTDAQEAFAQTDELVFKVVCHGSPQNLFDFSHLQIAQKTCLFSLAIFTTHATGGAAY
jgi:hypothetical protein